MYELSVCIKKSHQYEGITQLSFFSSIGMSHPLDVIGCNVWPVNYGIILPKQNGFIIYIIINMMDLLLFISTDFWLRVCFYVLFNFTFRMFKNFIYLVVI